MRLAPYSVDPEELLAGITEGYVAVDDDDRFQYVNEAACAILRRPPEALLGRVLWEVFPHGIGSEVHRACAAVRAAGDARQFVEYATKVDRWYSVKVSRLAAGLALYFHDITAQKEAEREVAWLAAKEGALRRVAEAVARDVAPREIHAAIALEAAVLLGAHASSILRFEDEPGEVCVLGSWCDGAEPPFAPGQPLTLSPRSPIRVVRDSGVTQRADGLRPDPTTQWGRIGCCSSVAAPVHAEGRLWGAISLGWLGDRPAIEVVRDLADFTGLVALAVGTAASRARLAERASSDPLTGLLNHRRFHEHLRAEVARARRHERPLSLLVLDIDSFKPINDSHGHQAGDLLLTRVGDRLRRAVRGQDLVARIGGDEFAVLLPETSGADALTVAEHVRTALASIDVAGRGITVSVGVCDLQHAPDAGELYRLADGALYWSKAHGRNVACLYDPAIVRELSAQERADQLARTQALAGLRGLARAIDAKDPSTRRHSDRVANLTERLALELGWTRDRADMLREAALLHDVGKIGVPDAVLLKPGRLTAEEYEAVKAHAGLGARIVDDILLPEQVAWIRHHHERWDGSGYPDALAAADIPEGAALIAVADAFDVMTAARPYSAPKPLTESISEICHLAGSQFALAATNALLRLHTRGELV